jgi:hypothetical protein
MTNSPACRRERRRIKAGAIGSKETNSTWYLPHFVLIFDEMIQY